MRKTILPALLFAASSAAAQSTAALPDAVPERMGNRQMAAEVGRATRNEFEQKQFAGLVRKLRDAVEKGDFDRASSSRQTVVSAMRREVAQARQQLQAVRSTSPEAEGEPTEQAKRAAPTRPAPPIKKDELEEKTTRLAKMEAIAAEAQAYYFKDDTREANLAALRRIDEFAAMLEKDTVEGFQKLGPMKQGSRN